jgi:hypothetical protein
MAEVRAGTHVSLPEEARGFFSVLMRLGHLDVGYCCFLIGPVDTCRAPEAGDQASDPPGDAQHYPIKKATNDANLFHSTRKGTVDERTTIFLSEIL